MMVTACVYWIGMLLLAVVVVTTFGVPPRHYSIGAWIAVAEQGLLAIASTKLSYGNTMPSA